MPKKTADIAAKNEQLDSLNECARIIYQAIGYETEKGYDFSTARHPQERACFVIAVKTFNFWEEKINEK